MSAMLPLEKGGPAIVGLFPTAIGWLLTPSTANKGEGNWLKGHGMVWENKHQAFCGGWQGLASY